MFCSLKVHSISLTWAHDAIDELVSCDFTVAISVLSTEEVHDTRLVMVHPGEVSFTPVVKLEVLHTLKLWGGRIIG